VKVGKILCDADRRMQIADLSPIRLEMSEMEPYSGKSGVRRLTAPPADVPGFVSRIPEDCQSPESHRRLSFVHVVEAEDHAAE
jgi:hypothetical protein